MPDLQPVLDWIPRLLPLEPMEARFMQHALLALLLLAPSAAALGVQVVTFRMAFFSDAISHAVFAGVAIGLVAGIEPRLAMPVFGVLVALGIAWYMRNSSLPSDTVIGVMFALVVAAGLAGMSRYPNIARNVQQFVYGDILTITEAHLWVLLALFLAVMAFEIWAYNASMLAGVDPVLAQVHGVRVARLQYAFSVLTALVVTLSVWTVGVFLVTALLIVPATAGRNLASTAGRMFWWSQIVGVTSAVAGLLISTHPAVRTATGATVVLVACAWFGVSSIVARARGLRRH